MNLARVGSLFAPPDAGLLADAVHGSGRHIRIRMARDRHGELLVQDAIAPKAALCGAIAS